MATFDNAGASSGAAVTTLSVTLTVGSGANRAVAVFLGFKVTGSLPTGVGVSGGGATGWAAVSGTDSGSIALGGGAFFETVIWAGLNPSSGSQTFTASWTGSQDGAFMGVITASGVTQSTPVYRGAFTAHGSGQSQATVSTQLTSLSGGDLPFDGQLNGAGGAVVNGDGAQTQRWNPSNQSGTASNGSTDATTPTATLGWTVSPSTAVWSQSAAAFQAIVAPLPQIIQAVYRGPEVLQ